MMKKVLVLMLVLGIASVANAGLVISVGGVVDPPETQVNLTPSEEVIIDIHGIAPSPMMGGFMAVQGPATLDMSNMNMVYAGDLSFAADLMDVDPDIYAAIEGILGPCSDILYYEFFDSGGLQPLGLCLDNMILHCEGLGDVTLTLTDPDVVPLDTQIIHQIPEPASMLLLGLGGLLLRRRK
jgi:hypothetical protein